MFEITCKNCKLVVTKNYHGSVFCSQSCSTSYNNKVHPRSQSTKKRRECQKCGVFSVIGNRARYCLNCRKQETQSKRTEEQKELVCRTCNETKPTSEFYTTNKGLFDVYCKKCKVAYNTNRWVNLKIDSVKYLGSECVGCGLKFDGSNYAIFDFHHKDPSSKTDSWNGMRKWSDKRRKEELDKCSLLCANCHRTEHDHSIEKEDKTGGKPRTCTQCNVEKTEAAFYERKARNTLHCVCANCMKKNNLRSVRKKKQLAIEYKGSKCHDCNQSFEDSAIYDFHHVDPSTKDGDWGDMRRMDLDLVFKELDKCILLCANCHRLRHSP